MSDELIDNTSTPTPQYETFQFNDFIADEVGIPYDYTFRDKVLHFRLKKSIDLKDRAKARDGAVVKKVNLQTGDVKILKVDDDAFSVGIAATGILEWPFRDPDGTMTPITVENVKKLPPMVIDNISSFLLGMRSAQVEDLDPFVNQSVEAS